MKLTPAQTKVLAMFSSRLIGCTGSSELRQSTASALSRLGLIQQARVPRALWPYEVGTGGYVLTAAGREWLARNGYADSLAGRLEEAADKWGQGSRLWATDRPGIPANPDESRDQAERASAFRAMARQVREWAEESEQ